MQLRNLVEWALHCCAVLAGLAPERYLPARDLAQFHGVPKEYLSKALQALSQAGLVEGTLWSEESIGTNAMGTTLAVDAPDATAWWRPHCNSLTPPRRRCSGP